MKIALCGLGKAGIQLVRLAVQRPELEIVMAFCRDGSKKAGKTISDVFPYKDFPSPIYEIGSADSVFTMDKPDVVIDFSSNAATMELLPACAKHGVKMVVCTTNFTDEDMRIMQDTARNTPGFSLVYAPNITLGVNVLMMLTEQTARCLPEFDFAITEKHHSRKADVSATARKITDNLSDILGRPVSLNSIRAGGYVGLHEVMAVSEYERITIIHESFSRQAFASGAMIAANYLLTREGYFEMRDVVADYLSDRLPNPLPA